MGTWQRKSEHYWHRHRKAIRESGNRYPSFAQVPGPWRVARLAGRIAAPRSGLPDWLLMVGAWFEWLTTRPKLILTRSGTLRFMVEALSVVIVFGTLWTFWKEYEDRREDRINRAWTLIAASKENTGNVGLVDALHTLRGYNILDFNRLTLPGAYLRGAILSNLLLKEANLKKTDLSRANLSRANLRGADLRGADLRGGDLRGADLGGADLSNADLREVDFRGADLSGVNLYRASLDDRTRLSAKWWLVWKLVNRGANGLNLSGVDLSNAHFGKVDLRKVNLSETNLSGANLVNADLREANLRGTDLSGANLGWADLRKAYLKKADLSKADLSGADLRKADLSTVELKGANLLGTLFDINRPPPDVFPAP